MCVCFCVCIYVCIYRGESDLIQNNLGCKGLNCIFANFKNYKYYIKNHLFYFCKHNKLL